MAVDGPAATLKRGIASLLETEEFSDVTITCKGKDFKAHKNVICTQSKFFYNACKKKSFKESQTGVIDLSHDDPLAVEAMYRYFYESDYAILANDNPEALLLHVRVYCLAHKYDIKTLKALAANQFQNTAQADFNSTLFPTFSRVVREIYEKTQESDNRLRNLAVMTTIDNCDDLLKEADGEFGGMMVEFGEFGRDLAVALMPSKRREFGEFGRDLDVALMPSKRRGRFQAIK